MLVVAPELQKDVLMLEMIDSWRGVVIFSEPRKSDLYKCGYRYIVIDNDMKTRRHFVDKEQTRKYINYLVDNWKPVN